MPPPGWVVAFTMQVLFAQRITLGIGIDIADQDHDTLDQAPNGCDKRQRKAGQHTNEHLRNSLAGIAQIEIMDTEAAQENTQ